MLHTPSPSSCTVVAGRSLEAVWNTIAACGVGLWVAILAALEFAECLFVALESGLAGPVAGLGVVVLDPLAEAVEMAELELGFGVALIRGLAIPSSSLRIAE